MFCVRLEKINSLQWGVALSILLYLLLTTFLWFSLDGTISSITSDLDFYNHFIVSHFPGWASEASIEINEISARIVDLERDGWIGSPFYTIIFLAPIWLFGSEALLFCLGVSIGILSIFGYYLCLKNCFSGLGNSAKVIILVLTTLNFNFIVDSVGVSTMSIAACFVVWSLLAKKYWIRALLMVCAAMIRSNFAIALIAFFLVYLILRGSLLKKFLWSIVPSLAVYLLSYKYVFSTYPGGGLNALFFMAYQGIDYSQQALLAVLTPSLGISTESELFRQKITIPQFIGIASRPKVIAFLFNAWALKLSVTLGFVHEKLFSSMHEIFLTKIWRTAYFIFLSLPGMFSAAANILLVNISKLERALYLWAVLYISINSLLIGDPRYLIGVHFILALALVRITTELINYKKMTSRSKSSV